MSTFNGRVAEFPDIRIDYFRVTPRETPKPVAFFLSHVHSDHLSGLESCKSPFIYCSPATREILLRLEKYPHRMNFAKGILESRKQTYKHLQKLLKPIPLETPTVLELSPGRSIRVTLFDANHCTGATMFLIEDDQHAILYTGDIRSEQWWVDSLVRHPVLVPYVSQNGRHALKKLDCMYLDTSFGTSQPECRRFPTKQEGITELLSAVAKYPTDTTFYFNPWTFGYEEVWLALSTFLRSKIHVDDYRYGLYASLKNTSNLRPNDTHHLMGYYCGNHPHEGCLTRGPARLHSCEYGAGCEVFQQDIVRIVPIITRYNGVEISEVGIGGGQGDLDQRHELELGDDYMMLALITLCREKLKDHPEVLQQTEELLAGLQKSGKAAVQLDPIAMAEAAAEDSEDKLSALEDLPIDMLVPAIVKLVHDKHLEAEKKKPKPRLHELRADGLPRVITFPYSRHASYDELRILLAAFLPTEIYPCTIDLDDWTMASSMEYLFGDLYGPEKIFRHDDAMKARASVQRTMLRKRVERLDAEARSTPIKDYDGVNEEALVTSSPLKDYAPVNGADLVASSLTVQEDEQPAALLSAVTPSNVKRKRVEEPVLQDRAASRKLSMSSDAVKKAMQREIFDIITEGDGRSWFDIELISTHPREHSPEL